MRCALLRGVIGNPFRPAPAPPATRDAVALAYDERLADGTLDPARLCVLADALDDAGGSGELLAHLRSFGPHVRGCWAVDSLLRPLPEDVSQRMLNEVKVAKSGRTQRGEGRQALEVLNSAWLSASPAERDAFVAENSAELMAILGVADGKEAG